MNQSKSKTPQTPIALQQLQADFKAYLFEEIPSIYTSITATSDEQRESRLQIYQNAYYLRLIDSLKQDYEALHTVLGEQEFTQLVLAYIRLHPSSFASLRHYGDLLAKFIRQSAYFKGREYVAELAQLQWLLVEAFDAADKAIISEQVLAQIPPLQWPEIHLTFHPSIRRMTCQWNTVEIYAATKSQIQTPAAIPLEEPMDVLVWRHKLVTRYRTLAADESTLLIRAIEGTNFSELCEHLNQYSDDHQQNAMRAASLLKTWVHDGLVTGVDCSTTP